MDRSTAEYFLEIIDDAERVLSSDTLAEDIARVSYALKNVPENKAVKKSSFEELYNTVASCHECGLCFSRRVFSRPIIKKGVKVLFIISGPSGDSLLSPEEISLFQSWWKKSIYLEEGEWALTTLVKCPSSAFSRDAADKCRVYLRTEMEESEPQMIIVMGHDAASYILGKNLPIDDLRNRRFLVNKIPLYVTYSPADFLQNKDALRQKVWSDMLLFRKALGLEPVVHGQMGRQLGSGLYRRVGHNLVVLPVLCHPDDRTVCHRVLRKVTHPPVVALAVKIVPFQQRHISTCFHRIPDSRH